MNSELCSKLRMLACKYETEDFINDDPSQFMHRYRNIEDIETAAFIAANLSFGRRDQILKHVDLILEQTDGKPAQWIKDGEYKAFFLYSDKSFYRMFTFKTMRLLCDRLREMLKKENSLGSYFESVYQKNKEGGLHLSALIANEFCRECSIIPHGESSANKRLNMFLRWMVRDNSPVDLGLWTWFKKTDLLIPMDTHVIHTAVQFNLLEKTPSGNLPGATMKNALALTGILKEAFPDDPVKGDFALFGLGVNS
ncbi:MAG: TIGR02757 family protein [Treponema sp.]|nr:TIGR02757 family protein [Treponema sp.]